MIAIVGLAGLFCAGHAFFVLPEYLRALDFIETGYVPEAKGVKPPTTAFPLPGESSASDGTPPAEEISGEVAEEIDGPGRTVEVAPATSPDAKADAPAPENGAGRTVDY